MVVEYNIWLDILLWAMVVLIILEFVLELIPHKEEHRFIQDEDDRIDWSSTQVPDGEEHDRQNIQ